MLTTSAPRPDQHDALVINTLIDELEKVAPIEDYLCKDLWKIVASYWMPASRLKCPIDGTWLTDPVVVIKEGVAPVFYNRTALARAVAANELSEKGVTTHNLASHVITVAPITNRYWDAIKNRRAGIYALLNERQDPTNLAMDIQRGMDLSEALDSATPLQLGRVRTRRPRISPGVVFFALMPFSLSFTSSLMSATQMKSLSAQIVMGLNALNQSGIKAATHYRILNDCMMSLSYFMERVGGIPKMLMLTGLMVLPMLGSLIDYHRMVNDHLKFSPIPPPFWAFAITWALKVNMMESMVYIEILLRENERDFRTALGKSWLLTALTAGGLLAAAGGGPSEILRSLREDPLPLNRVVPLLAAIPSVILSSQQINAVMIDSGTDLIQHRRHFFQRTRHRYSNNKLFPVLATLLLGAATAIFTQDPLLGLFVTINALSALATLNRVRLATNPYILMPRPAARLPTNDAKEEHEARPLLGHDMV
jgi:hypothetical protein